MILTNFDGKWQISKNCWSLSEWSLKVLNDELMVENACLQDSSNLVGWQVVNHNQWFTHELENQFNPRCLVADKGLWWLKQWFMVAKTIVYG